MARVYGKDKSCLAPAMSLASEALNVSSLPPAASPLVLEEISAP